MVNRNGKIKISVFVLLVLTLELLCFELHRQSNLLQHFDKLFGFPPMIVRSKLFCIDIR